MGKKTNWTVTEDQTLCHAWLDASELQLQTGDHKATSFWNSVHELFQQKAESSVERPLNGLKIRWTRINRDSQKFALIFHEVQAHGMKIAEENSGEPGDAAAVVLLTEQQWIEEAKDQFLRSHGSKFSFETCWKLLRYAPKWQQLVDNASSRAPALTAPTFLSEDAKRRHKRRATQELLDAGSYAPLHQFYGLASTLVDEIKRHNNLLEDQNTIALLRVDPDMIPDGDGRNSFHVLRNRYLKKARTTANEHSDNHRHHHNMTDSVV
ncbi:hypothetical protein BBO99_00000044 [Phytophthora kernoviae]|uniref:No apical meristem-associated C-terminal domain-containing protein n=2 Tax=Phytophthora kernoviae TaxID=325452 RepID=A0A421F715_9STRA|nr:hypothetical protein G195_004689 [Phytophthora kernoviae 00238/432]KAG2533094.1 hypothetical protein JM16_000190 [Phytophthora kernoviae]KAG2533330.1 hypothetical protein JM18_000163 [Phytophthora kernoviae]RLN26825.1 hypothetical protein BBI17_000044 [Phytophthora kernoviae]RLN85932.1 hypothetical protein BBO99_00000044 [Phytophthora kernoviae]